MTTRFSRSHALLRATLIGLAAPVVACNQTANPVRPSATTEAPWSLGITAEAVGDDLAKVRQATVQFHDFSEAIAAGYTTEFEPCVAIPGGPAMGGHARNESLMADQIVDPLRPELLLYEPKPNGDLRLVGVEYDSNNVYVIAQFPCVSSEVGPPTCERNPLDGIYKSVDAGATFELIFPSMMFRTLTFDPIHPNVMFSLGICGEGGCPLAWEDRLMAA